MKDLLPIHTEQERAQLKEDIERNGLQVPVVIDEHDNVIDGFLRKELAEDLKIDWKKAADVRFDLGDIEKQALRIRLNLLRRTSMPTRRQRQQCRQVLLMAHPELSDQLIADMCGASRATIQRERKELAQNGKLMMPLSTVGSDGKRRKANRKPRTIVSSKHEYAKVANDWNDVEQLGGKKPTGLFGKKNLGRKANSIRRKSRREGEILLPLPEHFDLHHCDHATLKVEPGSIDLILTDVLWTLEARDGWKQLAELACEWLKPNGIYASYIGTYVLDEFISQTKAGGLKFQWVFPVLFPPNGQSSQEIVGVTAMWRPVVAFSVKHTTHDFGGMLDTIQSGKPEKQWHKYQQPESSTRTLVEQLSKPGDLILDPCVGTGTTGIACLNAEGGIRRFIGCDKDEEMYQSARKRVDEFLVDQRAAA